MECSNCKKPLPTLLIAGAMRCRQCGHWTVKRKGGRRAVRGQSVSRS